MFGLYKQEMHSPHVQYLMTLSHETVLKFYWSGSLFCNMSYEQAHENIIQCTCKTDDEHHIF